MKSDATHVIHMGVGEQNGLSKHRLSRATTNVKSQLPLGDLDACFQSTNRNGVDQCAS
jgi:hypothetical protein